MSAACVGTASGTPLDPGQTHTCTGNHEQTDKVFFRQGIVLKKRKGKHTIGLLQYIYGQALPRTSKCLKHASSLTGH